MKGLILSLTLLFLIPSMGFGLPSKYLLEDLEGKRAVLSDESLKLVVFWATWCSNCGEKLKTYLPELDLKEGIEVIAINVDVDIERAKKYVEAKKLKVRVFRHPLKKLQQDLQIYSVPYWVVYKRQPTSGALGDRWVLVDHKPGFETKQVEKALDPALKDRR